MPDSEWLVQERRSPDSQTGCHKRPSPATHIHANFERVPKGACPKRFLDGQPRREGIQCVRVTFHSVVSYSLQLDWNLAFTVLTLFVVSAQAEVTVFFGPEEFVRGTASPQIIARTFTNPLPTNDFILRIANGDGTTLESHITSAVVKLNTDPVLGPKDFGEDVEFIEVPVALFEGENEISVEFGGGPGSYFSLVVEGPPDTTAEIPLTGGSTTLQGCCSFTFPGRGIR